VSGRAVIATPRELDVLTADDLLARVRRVDPEAGPVDIDLRRVEFIDSIGLRSLMEADRLLRERRSGRPRILVAPRGPVERLLQLTLLDHTLDVRVGEAPAGTPIDPPRRSPE
jgi:anti-anti-sigma factor